MGMMMNELKGWMLLVVAVGACVIFSACGKSEAQNLAKNPKPPAEEGRDFKVIHVSVALCDNESQGIAPVPVKIGDGDDPANNLYWGCSDGAKRYFAKSKLWTRVKDVAKPEEAAILERLIFRHKKTKAIMVVDAWRGSEIEKCLKKYCESLAGQHYESVAVGAQRINVGGGADLQVFIGHNGLMEFSIPAHPVNPNRKNTPDAMVLCCRSKDFFMKHLGDGRANPLLLTATNMYPGAFILHDAMEGWFLGEKPTSLRQRAAKAYAKNQKIRVKGALSVFAPLE